MAGRLRMISALALLALAFALSPALAERSESLPSQLEGIGIFPRNGEKLPMDLNFTDSEGETRRLGDLIAGDKPVLLSLVYYNCPMLCNLFLDGLVDGLKELDWTAGQEFEMVTLSIDPNETRESAARKKAHQIEGYGRPSAAAGWHFLFGEEKAIRQVADAVGFKYEWDPELQMFKHAAGMFVIAPDGTISQTLFGLVYDEKTLRLALVDAAQGEIGSIFDHALLFCFKYDAASGHYAPAAWIIMRLGVGAVTVALAIMLITLWLRGRRRRRVALGGGAT